MLRPQERAFTASVCLLLLQAVFLAACDVSYVSYNINPLGYGYVYDQMASPTPRTVVIPTVAVTKRPDVLLKQGGLGNTLDTFLAKYTLLTISRPPTLYAFQQTLDAWPGGSILLVSLESGAQDQAPRAMQFSLVPGTNHPTTYEQAEAFVQSLLPSDLTGPTTVRIIDTSKGKCTMMVWHSTDLSRVFPPADFLSESSGKLGKPGDVVVSFFPHVEYSTSFPDETNHQNSGAGDTIDNPNIIGSLLVTLGDRPAC